MSKKIVKIWGLLLTIMLIASVFVPAAPASALYGQMQWAAQPLPSATGYVMLNGSDVTGLAQGSGVIYAVSGQEATGVVPAGVAIAPGGVFKSTDGGSSWIKCIDPAAGIRLTKVSVAPDNANVIAVTDGINVYTSTDGGSGWSNLTPTGLGATWAGAVITDVKVAPARSGTLLGREYIVTVADPAVNSVLKGDVLIIGTLASWASVLPVGQGNGAGQKDYVAVAVTPNFVGDLSVVALGAGITGSTWAGVIVQVINTTAVTPPVTANLSQTTGDFCATAGAVATSITGGSVALPADFDATNSSGQRAYAGFSSNVSQADNDVYRADANVGRTLSAMTGQSISSVSYSGTVSSGTLFAARKDQVDVRYSTDMTSSAPTWTTTKKLMPVVMTNSVVMAAADFATTKKVYVGTSGVESSFSISTDGGISFNQKSLIDNGVTNNVREIQSGPTFSGKTLFLATRANNRINLWTSPVPTTDTSWTRIFVGENPAGTKGWVSLSPDFTTTSVMYFFDVVAGGNIYRSADGGATWNTRMAPTTTFLIEAIGVIQDANVSYVTNLNGDIYKSTNGAWTWTGPVNAQVGNVKALVIGRTDELLVGGTGKIGISKDGGTTFTVYDGDPGVFYRVGKDTNYATNNILWVADAAGVTNEVYRFQVGTDTKPVALLSPTTAQTTTGTPAIKGGVLYVFHQTVVDRAVNPTDTPGTINWKTTPAVGVNNMGVGSSATDVDTILYMRRSGANTAEIWAFDDQMAAAKPKITFPADNLSLSVNPVTGIGDLFTVTLQPMGTGNGLADRFDVQITEKAAGWAAATTNAGFPLVPIQVTSPVSPQISSANFAPAGGMLSNRVYQYRIRAAHSISGAFLDSKWSDPMNVTVASGGRVSETSYGPQLVGPTGGATNVGLTPGFAWAPVYGANKYQFKLATDAALTKTVAGTPVTVSQPSFQVTAALTAGATYFWSVQVIDPSAGPVSIGTFTTAPKAAPVATAAPPVFTMPPITIPPIVIPPQPTPTITVQAPAAAVQQVTPAFIWAIIIIGAILVIAVIVLIVRTRKTP